MRSGRLPHELKNMFFLIFSRKGDISKCLYEYRVIITCYKKILGDKDGCKSRRC
jgi:hypothetical protein